MSSKVCNPQIKLSEVVITSIGWTIFLTAAAVAAVFTVNCQITALESMFDCRFESKGERSTH